MLRLTREIVRLADSFELDCFYDRCNHGTIKTCQPSAALNRFEEDLAYNIPRPIMVLKTSFCFRPMFMFQKRLAGKTASMRSTSEQTARTSSAVGSLLGPRTKLLTSLEEARIFLDMNIPAITLDAMIPELLYWLALGHADDDRSEIDDKLNCDNGPQEPATSRGWGNNSEQQIGVRDSAEARAHDGENFAKVDPFERVHLVDGVKVLHVLPEAPRHADRDEDAVTKRQGLWQVEIRWQRSQNGQCRPLGILTRVNRIIQSSRESLLVIFLRT